MLYNTNRFICYFFIILLYSSWVAITQPASAQSFDLKKKAKNISGPSITYANTDHQPKLDVIIPVFDPNIPKKDKDDVWPEVRRAEANRFAWMTKKAFEKSGAFGAVRVTPDDSGFGELYVHGKILKANGEDIHLEITVNDIRGQKKTWLRKKVFKYRVQESFHKSPRTKGTDSYAPIFDKITQAVVKVLAKRKAKDVKDLKSITNLRFANMFGADYFSPYLKEKSSSFKLVSLPDDNDPAYAKIRIMRVQEQIFVDQMQPYYEKFVSTMNPHYYAWQEYAMPIAKERRKQKAAATLSAIIGVAATVAAATSDDKTVQGIGAGVAIGAGLTAYKKFSDAKENSSILEEMGSTLNLDMGSQVVEFEGIQTKLEGDAVEQFFEYRVHLMKIYESEYTPDVQL